MTPEKRGLFGISWLGGSKPGASDEVGSGRSSGSANGDGNEPSRGIAGFFERASVLLVLGLFALIGVGSGVYLMFFRPDAVVIPSYVHSIPRPSPTFEPLVVADPTKFLAALPTTDLQYGLRSAESTVMRPVAVWPSRIAEEWLLTYDAGASAGASGTMTVQAVQHYTLDAATFAYQHLLDVATAEALGGQPGGTSPSPAASASPSTSASPSPTAAPGIVPGTVYVNKVAVGKSFKVIKNVTESVANPAGGDPTEVTHQVAVVTWQNGTGVFVMTADPAVIGDLFTEYGL